MITIPANSSDSDIRDLVVEWNELLANENYVEALDMFPFTTESRHWTPELLAKTVQGYGIIDLDTDTLKILHDEFEVDHFVVSTLRRGENWEETVGKCIDVDRGSLYGLDPERYVGMVHYSDIPMGKYISDLTARFHIKKVDNDHITLEFLDIHQM